MLVWQLMDIVDLRVVVCSPGRNYVTVVIETSDGVVGIGDATLNGRELAVASYLDDHIRPVLLGRDARRITDIWSLLYKGSYWRGGGVAMAAISAVDVALWDLKGKEAGLPLHQLLGGPARDGVLVYGHASGDTLDDLDASVQSFLDRGYRAIRAQASVPGLESTYGIGPTGRIGYEPANAEIPDEEPWDSALYLEFAPRMLAHVRERFGFGFHLLHDVHHRLSPLEAARLGHDVEPARLWWLEDPTPAEDPAAFRVIRSHTTTPIAVGEVLSSIWDFQQLITERLVDYVRPAVSHAGGITHLLRIFALADLYGVRTGSHGPTDLSPVSLSAALQVDLAVPNFGIQEYMPFPSPADEVFTPDYGFEDGYLHPSVRPGLGVEFDEVAAARFPYRPRQLPVARRFDGSVHDW